MRPLTLRIPGWLVLVAWAMLSGTFAANGAAAEEERFEVGFWVDHQDFATPGGGRSWDTVSPKGLEEIIDYCRQAGANSIYFRGFGGGLVIHNSRLEEGLYPQLIDKRRTSDPLYHNGGVRYGVCQPDIVGAVAKICHRKGIKCLLSGTGPRAWRGMAPGTRKDLGYFWIGTPGSREIVLCESAIDSMSCFQLDPQRICISTSGVRADPPWLDGLLARGYQLSCGFDADAPGDAAATHMLALYPAVRRLRPPAHDWNDALTSSR
jgi:hypothetical protein